VALTHQLDQRGTPVREFFEAKFPPAGFKVISKAWYEQVRAAPIVCEPPAGVNPGTIGTAFDYRARLCWAPLDWTKTVAAGGMFQLIRTGHTELGLLLTAVGEELERVAPDRCGAGLERDREERICRCCYVLALYEQFFRTAAAAASSPLLEVVNNASIEEVLALAPQAGVDDLAAMAALLCERLANLVESPAVLNPTFDGSVAIGGADADLVVDRMLLELKTTKQDKFERVDHVCQLLGYALLDYSNEYEIDRVGVYLARRGVLVSWSIGELMETCCTTRDWSSLQRGFKEAVAAIAPAFPIPSRS
jgi:hypothetical protein